ncbi:energy transducer TonB [Sphingomonas sp.]|uniref:energy transducer TonB n=1 Tax=Sphingomonas sp. TaxID=28214 RepID=UPI0025F5C456|nr:energy transducer TonB [Sphingomonas sp.]
MNRYLGNSARWKGAVGAMVVQGVLLWALIAGLAVSSSPALRDRIASFALTPDQPAPPPPPPQTKRNSSKEGAASPANIRSTATEIVAPKPILPPPPQPIAAAPVANTGVQTTQGAAPVEGPGYGAGSVGNGFGSGGAGDGDGAGDGRDTPPRRIGGRIKPSDLPDDLAYNLSSGVDLTVGVKYAVEEDGRVTDCRITRSSGNRALDLLTCDLIERKFRYRPALDENREPFKSWIVENHTWNFEDADPQRR